MMAVLLLGTLYAVTPHAAFGGHPPDLLTAFFGAWMALFAQPILMPPERWYLALLCGAYPLLGFGLVGEGIVRIGMLILSKERGEKEWMTVTASTYRDHIVLCGLGHLGFRILNQLLSTKQAVVALEKDGNARFLGDAKATGVPVLVRDMQEDQALLDAGVQYARAIIIATNDDMANLEVALDATDESEIPRHHAAVRSAHGRQVQGGRAHRRNVLARRRWRAPIIAEMAIKAAR
jgi:hypothetical protein